MTKVPRIKVKKKLQKLTELPETNPQWVKNNIKKPSEYPVEQWFKMYREPYYYAEVKMDGERGVLMKYGDEIYLVNRYATVYRLPKYLENKVKKSLSKFNVIILDGEFHSKDNIFNSFLHYRTMKTQEDLNNLQYSVFDVLNVEGLDVRSFKYNQRMDFLKQVKENSFMKKVKKYKVRNYSEAKKVFNRVVSKGYEGLVIKTPDGTYSQSGGDWVKWKVSNTLDFVVLGIKKTKTWKEYRVPSSLVIGFYDKEHDDYVIVGKVAGMKEDEKQLIAGNLDELKYDEDSEFIYMYPYYTVEVKYQQIMNTGGLRSPRVVRIRDDKSPEDTYKDYKFFMKKLGQVK